VSGQWIKWLVVGCLAPATLSTLGCGEFIRQDRSSVVVVLEAIEAASGAKPNDFSGALFSDVVTNVTRTVDRELVTVPTIFSDLGRVRASLVLKDPGQPGVSNIPSPINQVTFTRYHVDYVRADGRNRPGVDVPFAFDGGLTFSVPKEGNSEAVFELVRHVAKTEAPLGTLRNSDVVITTIAEITFFGHDQAGNAIRATGSITVAFGNFGDPE
jgi:hypothetical protein